ncbi:hypothetical protein VYF65_003181 [Lysinibacillus irui]|uniref:hypothetical protein n=1 Tax=Lysinibacillus irui TaxID=2998077 RepID=UPI00388B1B4A
MKFRFLEEDSLSHEYPNSYDYWDENRVISNTKAEIDGLIMLILMQVYSTTSYWITSFS